VPQNPLILVIDDSPTIRKLVECHLSEAGYRVAMAVDADQGVEMASTIKPDLILLDHQLPGTTGDEVCRRLLASEVTARFPVLVSSALRSRAFALYSEFPNVIDQIPKPFTPELLKSGVANALQIGAMVVQAQRTGCAMPEAVGEVHDAVLSGKTSSLPLRAVFDLLTNTQIDGRLTLEQGKHRHRFAIAGGRFQAIYSSTITPDTIAEHLPDDLADLAPLLSITLGEHQDASMSGLVKLLERSLTDPRRLRMLLRAQSAILTYLALTGDAGDFSFEARVGLPPMFQAFPLQTSLPALAVEGVKRCGRPEELARLGPERLARQTPRGGNLDRTGLSQGEIRVHALFDGVEPLEAIARKAGVPLLDAAALARGLELVGQLERKAPADRASILFLEDDAETVRAVLHALGAEGENLQLRHVRDRVAAQLLLRRQPFGLVMLPLDTPDQEAFYTALRENTPETTRFVGILRIEDESQFDRIDTLNLDGVIPRPVSETDLRATIRQLIGTPVLASAC
jgi:DNA-binding response OmpR family regulator